MLVTIYTTMVTCSNLVKTLFFVLMITHSESPSPVTVHCGKQKTDLINVTYNGEAYSVYSAASEVNCVAEVDPQRPAMHTITGANIKPCGLKWDESLASYLFSIRIQARPIVSDDDQVYSVSCSYGDVDQDREEEFKIEDPNFVMSPVIAEVNITKIDMAVLNADEQPISSIEDGKYIRLKVDASRFTNDSVDVTRCSIVDNIDGDPRVEIKFLHKSCGTGYLMTSQQGFTATEVTVLQSDLFPVYNTFHGMRYLVCYLSICSSGRCKQGCVTPYTPQNGVVQQIVATTELEVTKPPIITTTPSMEPDVPKGKQIDSTTELEVAIPPIITATPSMEPNLPKGTQIVATTELEMTKPPIITITPPMEPNPPRENCATPGSIPMPPTEPVASQVPYYICIGALLFVIVVFVVFLLVKDRRYIVNWPVLEKQSLSPVYYIPRANVLPTHEHTSKISSEKKPQPYMRTVEYSEKSVSTSPRSSESLLPRISRTSIKSPSKSTSSIMNRWDFVGDDVYRFYSGKGSSYAKRVGNDPTMVSENMRFTKY